MSLYLPLYKQLTLPPLASFHRHTISYFTHVLLLFSLFFSCCQVAVVGRRLWVSCADLVAFVH